MSKFFAVPGDNSGLSSSDEESLYGSSSSDLESSDVSERLDSSSESESESDSEPESDSEQDDQPRNQYLRNQFLKGQGNSDSDSDDERIVVKSAKEKLLDEITSESSALEQNVEKEDWVSALGVFERLVKAADRAYKQYTAVTDEFTKALATLEGALAKKDGKKQSSSMSKAKNTLNQRMKKTRKEVNDRLALIEAARKAKLASESASASKASSPASGVSVAAPTTQQAGASTTLSSETVFQTLQSVIESRGRKNTDRWEQVSLLERQLAVAEGTYEQASLLLMLIPLRFDLLSLSSQSASHGGADFAPWEQIEKDIRKLFDVLESQNEYIVLESAVEPENIEEGPAVGPGNKRAIPGSLTTLVERLDDEHARILATYDPHTTEYLERLRDETRLAELLLRTQCHQEASLLAIGAKDLSTNEPFCRLIARRIDHIYYKPAVAVEITEKAAWERVPKQLNTSVGSRPSGSVNVLALLSDLCKLEYQQNNAVLRARAMLSLIYQYALSNDFYKARDLLLMSHLQSQISSFEPSTQVLFNRALVQIGLCAFRNGLVGDALRCLQDICGGARLKELLGQGAARTDVVQPGSGDEVLALEPGVEAPGILPFHMHINLELVECVYLTSSMLSEIPFLATIANSRAAQQELKKRSQNRQFRRLLDSHDRQVFNGPSETTRDYVIQASKRLQVADWRAALELLGHIKVWNLLSPSADAKESALKMLAGKLKVEALRTYIFTYGSAAYHSLALSFLQTEFELEPKHVHEIVVKMIAQEEVAALLDPSSSFLVFKPEADVSSLQTLALAIADKASQLVERNERLATDGHVPEQKRQMRAR